MNVRVVNFIINGESHMAVVKSSNTEFTYEEYMDAIPKSCGPEECYYFMNEDGSVIPPEIFISYVDQNFLRQNDKVLVGIINTNDGDVDLADDAVLNEINVISIKPARPITDSTSSESNTQNSNLSHKETQIAIEDLRQYIIQNDGEYLLKKYGETSSLSDPHRKSLVAIVVKKLTTDHSFWPTTTEKIQCAKIAVQLFPAYKTNGVNNYELFYDPANQRGFINSRLKTVQKHVRETTGQRKQKLKVVNSKTNEEVTDISHNLTVDALKDQYKDDIDFLKNCPTTNASAILERMKTTFPMRKAILDSEQKHAIWEIFPCYLTSSDIITQDYLIRTGCAKTNSKLVQLIVPIFEKYASLKPNKNASQGVDNDWDSFTNGMLTLLKLLPTFRKSGNKKQKTQDVQVKAANVFDKLIVFVKSNHGLDEIRSNCIHPILVAVGPVKNTILNYFINLSGQLLPAKSNCTPIEAFDYLFKAHVAFNCNYDWELKSFFEFLQYFIYDKREGVILTTRQIEISKLISN